MKYVGIYMIIYVICFILSLTIISITTSQWPLGLSVFMSAVVASVPAGIINMFYLGIQTQKHFEQQNSVKDMPIRKAKIIPSFIWHILDVFIERVKKTSKNSNQNSYEKE